MTKSIDPYPLHSLPIKTSHPTPLSIISTAIHLFYHASWLEESSRVRRRVLPNISFTIINVLSLLIIYSFHILLYMQALWINFSF
jgi:hypothetical protein